MNKNDLETFKGRLKTSDRKYEEYRDMVIERCEESCKSMDCEMCEKFRQEIIKVLDRDIKLTFKH